MTITHDYGSHAFVPAVFRRPPTSEKPILRLGRRLVDGLARAGWDIPGFEVGFETSRRGGSHLLRRVVTVGGTSADGPFRLRFDSRQIFPDRQEYPTGLSRVVMPPGISVDVSDILYHPPRLRIGIAVPVEPGGGFEWRSRTGDFDPNTHTRDRLRGLPRAWIFYSGSPDGVYARSDTCGGYAHSPAGRERKSIRPRDLIGKAEEFLMSEVISRVEALDPAPGHDEIDASGMDENMRRLLEIQRTPAPANFPRLWSRLPAYDRHRFSRPDKDVRPDSALLGTGLQFLRLADCPSGNPRSRAFSGCTYGRPVPDRWNDCLFDTPHAGPGDLPVEIHLRWLDGIHVVDLDLARETRRSDPGEVEAEVAFDEVARSLVAARDYLGDYADPHFIIARDLGFDECKLVRGHVDVVVSADQYASLVLTDTEGTKFSLMEPRKDAQIEAGRLSLTVERIFAEARENLADDTMAPQPSTPGGMI